MVDASDVAAVKALIGTATASADFNCDGTVNAADEAIITAHLGHTCPDATSGRNSTWGRLKTIYR